MKDERLIESRLRKNKLLIPFVTIVVGALLYAGICFCLVGFRLHYYWTIFPAGLLAHAFFIVIVHDGAHRNITRSKFDSFLMNFGSGIMLLPFYGEPFRKFHLIHHVNANTEHDPLWSDKKNNLYTKHRWLYIISQFIPILFTAYILFNPNKEFKTVPKKIDNLKIRPYYLIFSFAISILVIYFFRPPVFFVLGTLLFLNFLSALRHWCEHMGTAENIESNTFWFPLGMGIGNHDVHHDHMHYSWLTLAIGLRFKKKDTNPLKTLVGIIFKPSFRHFRYIKK